jgi:hypothetical protein
MNKKSNFVFLSLFLLIISCGNKDLTLKVTECVYPDAPSSAAPLWVCGALVEGVGISSVGTTALSKAGVNFMEQQAIANARVLLAQQVQVGIESMVKNFTETTGIADSETVDSVASVVSKQITTQSLSGTKIYKKATSPNGALYVLVGFDKDLYANFVKEQLNTSYGNDKALWQKAMSDKAFEELKADVERRVNQPK